LARTLRDSLADTYNVVCSANGVSALQNVKSREIDLIISDIMMGVMDGYQFLQELQKIEGGSEIPFIFLTARTGTEEEIKGLSSGAIDYIQKPFSIAVLKARINSLLEFHQLKRNAFELERYRAVSMLTAGLCHEILNPLSGIKGPLHVIESNLKSEIPQKPDKSLKGLSLAMKNVERISEIVGTMRSLFHGEEYSVEEIELHAFARSLSNVYGVRAQDRVAFELDIPENITIITNRGALTQIVTNLFSNAIESIPEEGTVKIVGDSKSLVIRDNGCGVPEDKLHKIFEFGYTTKKEAGGTGLGLFIVKELAERLGIGIAVDSQPGRGTEFHLTFREPKPGETEKIHLRLLS
jgi:signal transduction histidine kinase